jgi:hypothetical protein
MGLETIQSFCGVQTLENLSSLHLTLYKTDELRYLKHYKYLVHEQRLFVRDQEEMSIRTELPPRSSPLTS